MNIIAGTARNLELSVPQSLEVRPTVGRARKALFDSLGPMTGRAVLDLFSGSGALALEAVSRGASRAVLVEQSEEHVNCIRYNCERVQRTGAASEIEIVSGDALEPGCYLPAASCSDLIFADPPYAVSGEAFRTLLANDRFLKSFSGAQLVWEIPDTPGAAADFLNHPAFSRWKLRRFGSTDFLIGWLL